MARSTLLLLALGALLLVACGADAKNKHHNKHGRHHGRDEPAEESVPTAEADADADAAPDVAAVPVEVPPVLKAPKGAAATAEAARAILDGAVESSDSSSDATAHARHGYVIDHSEDDDDSSSSSHDDIEITCDPRRELHWFWASMNGQFLTDVGSMYAANAKRHDNGVPSPMTAGYAWSVDQNKCIFDSVPNLNFEVVHITRGPHKVGGVQIVMRYGNSRTQFEADGACFYEFDHNCKIAHEHCYWDVSKETTKQFIERVRDCFTTKED